MEAPRVRQKSFPHFLQKPNGPSAAFHGCALIFAMCFPCVMAWVYFVALAQPASGDGRPAAGAFPVYLLSKVVQFGFPVLWVWCFERYRLRPSVPSFRGLALGVGFGLLVGGLIFFAYHGLFAGSWMLADTPGKIQAKLHAFHADTPKRYLLLGLFLAGIHSLMEEYYWRWFVFGELRRRLPIVWAIGLSSLAFMAHHVVVLAVFFPRYFFTVALPLSFCVAAGGVAWSWLYQRTGTIYSAWLSHLLIDAAILAVGYEMVFMQGR